MGQVCLETGFSGVHVSAMHGQLTLNLPIPFLMPGTRTHYVGNISGCCAAEDKVHIVYITDPLSPCRVLQYMLFTSTAHVKLPSKKT